MKKEISPEMYNYNKFPGPEFVLFDTIVKSDDLEFTLVENVKDAFDTTSFGQRYTEILLKYDYIVGDWGNEQLRLRGFYKDTNDIKKSSRISRLDDYIKEFCNFGCGYFVLENSNPQEIKFEEEKAPRRKKTNKNSKRKPQQKDQGKKPNRSQTKRSDKTSNSYQEIKPKSSTEKQTFAKKKRDKQDFTNKSRSRHSEKKQANDSNDHFIIRKKG